ncbi:MAG: 2-polyprenylphenol 6-hydroxylase [Rickettsiaceae bacterium]|nr:2-polyprenylphenol 6-hydroxylase [Rickettsiaceae bacterium]
MIKYFNSIATICKLLFLLNKYQLLKDIAKSTKLPISAKLVISIFNIIVYRPFSSQKNDAPEAERFANALQSMGPIYIKLGQMLSTRPDLIGIHNTKYLRRLQDQLPEFEYSIAKTIIEAEFNQPINTIFSEFNEKPIAAASIAQVHKAKLVNGEDVAVKILRPGIQKQYEKDIAFLEDIADILTSLLKSTQRFRLREVTDVFKHSMQLELNLKFEAAAASRLRENFEKDPTLLIPYIYWQFNTDKILVTQWIQGVSIYDKDLLTEFGLDYRQLAVNLANIFFNQAHRDGFFHADLHPGNILVCPNGQIALIDFGIIGILPEKDRLAIAEILYAFLKKDYQLVAEIHHKAGYIPPETNLEYFAQSCRAVAEPIIGLNIQNMSIGKILTQLFHITKEYGMEAQPQLILLQKTMLAIEGITQILDKDINMWQVMEPWMKKWAIKNISPEARILRFIKKTINKIFSEI